jgi:hypothetical protein
MLATAAGAGELRLSNGALIPGELKRIDDHSIVWRAQLIGDITVETKSIASVDSITAARLQVGAGETLEDCHVSGGATNVALRCADQPELATQWRDVETAEAESSGKMTASLTRERGNSFSDDYEGDARATWRRGQRRHQLEGSLDYEKKRDYTAEDEAELGYQLDFLRRDGWYLYTKLDYTRDRLEALQETTLAGVGIGRTLHPWHGVNLRLQGGPDLVRYDLQNYGRGSEEGGNLQWRVDWKTALPRLDLTLFHEGEYGWLFVDGDISRLDTRTGVSIPLIDRLIAEIRLDYDRVGLQLPGIDNTDQEWVFALGYTW